MVPPISIDPKIPDEAFIVPLSSASIALTSPFALTSKLDPTFMVPPKTFIFLAITDPSGFTENFAS
jgi:hypothetical protein